MGHLSQFNPVSKYDPEVKGDPDHPELELTGTTQSGAGTEVLAIHLAVVQRTEQGTVAASATKGVPAVRVGDPTWEARVASAFEPGEATAFGLQVEFDTAAGAFQTVTWAQTITIVAGALDPDDETT